MAHFCSRCGRPLKEDARFCSGCGTPVKPAEKAFSAAPSDPKPTPGIEFIHGHIMKHAPILVRELNAPSAVNQAPEERENPERGAADEAPERCRPTQTPETAPAAFSIFSRADWKTGWKRFASLSGQAGIILVNTRKVPDPQPFRQALTVYVAARMRADVRYTVLDLNDQAVIDRLPDEPTCDDVICLLETVRRVAAPRFLMLIGDRTVIPNVRWENEAADGDKIVDSDLPYITYSTKTPWKGHSFDLKNANRLGRVPASAASGFAEAIPYLRNTAKGDASQEKARSFQLSAQEWSKTSCVICCSFTDSKTAQLYLSPPCVADQFKRNGSLTACLSAPASPNLLYFNLHGGGQAYDWYGQSGNDYPVAFNADCLPGKDPVPYFLGVEACYGAKPTVTPAALGKSTLLRALQNNCLAFVGSTQIAYGSCNGNVTCADVLVGEFLHLTAGGATAGDAYIAALSKLLSRKADDTVIKTAAEFALYGDPSVSLLKMPKNAKVAMSDRIRVERPITTSAVTMSLVTVNGVAAERVARQVSASFSHFACVTPRYYRVGENDGYQAVYHNGGNDAVSSTLKVYFDEDGNVTQQYLSK